LTVALSFEKGGIIQNRMKRTPRPIKTAMILKFILQRLFDALLQLCTELLLFPRCEAGFRCLIVITSTAKKFTLLLSAVMQITGVYRGEWTLDFMRFDSRGFAPS
jgi:hypothetical protein